MRIRLPLLSRLGAAGVLALHLLAVAGAPLADAKLEAGLRGTHVEAESKKPCNQAHDHLFCQLCRMLGAAATPGSAAGLSLRPVESPRLAAVGVSDRRTPSPFRLGGGPRAPPLS